MWALALWLAPWAWAQDDDLLGDEAPIGEEPIELEPVEEEPIEDDPVEEEPVEEEPIEQDPIEDVPIGEDPIDDEPVDVAPQEELGDEDLLSGVAERPADDEQARKNRGRIVVGLGVGQWLVPGPTTHLAVQAHMGRWLALNLEMAAAGAEVLDPDGGRARVMLPTSVIGVALDPVTQRVKPQIGVDLTATPYVIDPPSRVAVATGMRVRGAIDATVAGPLVATLEGYLGSGYAPAIDEVNPAWPVLAPSTGVRVGLGVRW